jgi:hypothetical protein
MLCKWIFNRPDRQGSKEAKTLTGVLLPSVPGQPSGATAAVIYTICLIPSPLSITERADCI